MYGLLKAEPDIINNDKDLIIYQAHYCGLCKLLGAEYGHLSRLITSYEMTLVYLLWTSQNSTAAQFSKTRCPVRLSKMDIIYFKGSEIVADISVVLFYEKLLDDEFDEKKKLPVFILKRIRKKYQKAQNRLLASNFDAMYIHNLMIKQRKLETGNIHSLDRISEQTALVMAYIFQFLSGLNRTSLVEQEALREIGYCLGKWIYIMDGLIDLEQDSLLRRFNPFLLKCDFRGNKLRIYEIPGVIKTEIRRKLSGILTDIRNASFLVTLHRNQNLIENLMIKNLRLKTDIVFNAMEIKEKSHRKKLKVLQASVAGALIPNTVFASNGSDQLCGSCVGPILLCGIVAYGFKTVFRCGNAGGCCPCTSSREVEVNTGCGGKKRYQRGCDGKYRDSSCC